MRIQIEYMSFKNRWTISSSYDFQAHLQRSQRRCCFSLSALQWFEVLPGLLPALPGLLSALPGAPRCTWRPLLSVQSTLGFNHPGILVRQLSDTPRGSQWHNYILLMQVLVQSRLITASKYICNLRWLWPPSASPNSLDHGLQMYL